MYQADQKLTIKLQSPSQTRKLGFEIATLVQSSAVVSLAGELGAGKTTLAQGAAQALGIDGVISSPTFTMLNEYGSGRLPLYHLDLYRLRENAEAQDSAGSFSWLETELDELISGRGLVLIEWAEFFADYMRQLDHVLVELNYSKSAASDCVHVDDGGENGRTALISATGACSVELVEQLAIVYFS